MKIRFIAFFTFLLVLGFGFQTIAQFTPEEVAEREKWEEFLKTAKIDFEILDKAVQDVIWKFTNLFPGCLIKSLDSVRAKKKFFWDMAKNYNRHWLAVNMMTEAFMGFQAFNSKKITGSDVIDFIKYRQLIAQGHSVDDAFMEAVMPKPKE